MIQNLNLIQRATHQAMDHQMNLNYASFLASMHSSSLYLHRNSRSYLSLKQKCKREDSSVRRLFPQATLAFYNVLYIDQIRLTTRSYSHGKTTDDSNILFQLNQRKTFGRIRSIFTVDGENPLLFVAHLSNATPLVCRIDNTQNFECSAIQTSASTAWSFVLIEIRDFIEKVVFFEDLNGRCCFFRFPNLTHST